jgi:nitrate/TMAO reductase-like tetraheme cytochrome c subunit
LIGPRRVLSRTKGALRNVWRFWTSRPLLLTFVAGLIATGVAFGGMAGLSYSESPAFCGQCHTMTPEVNAHLNSPHENVACAECHVGNGITGIVKSKLHGAQQAVDLILGTYPKPIPPAASAMPPANEICLRCHDPTRETGDLLLTRSSFQEDQANTEQRTALVVRLSGDPNQGIHWHVLSKVEYVTPDQGKTITWIGVDRPDGTHEEFIAESQVEISSQAGQQATALQQVGDPQQMSCYDCHNRVGHEFTPPEKAMDDAMAAGTIDPGLPFIKKWGLTILSSRYTNLPEAYAAINALRESYQRDYPWVFLEQPKQLQQSLSTLAKIYAGTSSPQMDAAPSDYPNFMGHTDSAGCFRCHDGGHYKIDNGVLSNEPIPSRCDLCHTFPSVGATAPNVMIGPPPTTHDNPLWVFQHKTQAATLDVAATTCQACHSQTYCSNCHNSGATSVTHDAMFYNHAKVISDIGQQACAYCHQRPFCERCHQADKDKIFPKESPAPLLLQ